MKLPIQVNAVYLGHGIEETQWGSRAFGHDEASVDQWETLRHLIKSR